MTRQPLDGTRRGRKVAAVGALGVVVLAVLAILWRKPIVVSFHLVRLRSDETLLSEHLKAPPGSFARVAAERFLSEYSGDPALGRALLFAYLEVAEEVLRLGNVTERYEPVLPNAINVKLSLSGEHLAYAIDTPPVFFLIRGGLVELRLSAAELAMLRSLSQALEPYAGQTLRLESYPGRVLEIDTLGPQRAVRITLVREVKRPGDPSGTRP